MRLGNGMIVLVLAAMALTGGCSRVISESVGVVTGPKGEVAPLRQIEAPLGTYTRFELVPFEDDFGGQIPMVIQQELPVYFARQLADRKIPNIEGGKTLVIRGRYIHYEKAGVIDNVSHPLEEVIARCELVDKDSGAVLGLGNCVGRTTTSQGMGAAKKAEGLAKAIADWIDRNYPKEGRAE